MISTWIIQEGSVDQINNKANIFIFDDVIE